MGNRLSARRAGLVLLPLLAAFALPGPAGADATLVDTAAASSYPPSTLIAPAARAAR
ncbi:MAG TPA: hypothetical protein VGP16_22360 [Asanoa sp.]|nr:hypothetical protein [Asanoa sp.]